VKTSSPLIQIGPLSPGSLFLSAMTLLWNSPSFFLYYKDDRTLCTQWSKIGDAHPSSSLLGNFRLPLRSPPLVSIRRPFLFFGGFFFPFPADYRVHVLPETSNSNGHLFSLFLHHFFRPSSRLTPFVAIASFFPLAYIFPLPFFLHTMCICLSSLK